MNLDQLCKQYANVQWVKEVMRDFLADLPEKHRRPAPFSLYNSNFRDKIQWLTTYADYTIDEIDDFLVECQQP